MRATFYIIVYFMTLHAAHADAVRGSLFSATTVNARATTGSALFIGRAVGGLFADRPAHIPAFPQATTSGMRGSDVQMIRAIIQEAESRRDGYDAVQFGATIKPNKKPTQMTLAEVYAWIDATPGQPHAIGRYQFIPKTLRRVAEKIGAKPNERFGPELQDKLADVLLVEAGLQSFRRGDLGRHAFMNNLAKIWAGLPNSTGKSHYDGFAGNKAALSWARFDAAMTKISLNRG